MSDPIQVVVSNQSAVPVAVSGVGTKDAIAVSISPGIGPSVIVNGTATSIFGTAGVSPFIAGANISLTTTGGGLTISALPSPVLSVNGKTGAVSLTPADFSAASSVHTHVAGDISGLSTYVSVNSPVQSVAGRTGSVVLTPADISQFTTTARSSAPVQSVAGRTGSVALVTSDIALFTTSARASAPVQSVAGRTGNVMLAVVDITAAPAIHTHSTSDIQNFSSEVTARVPVVSVQGRTGSVVLTRTDLTAAAATHTHSYVTSLNGITGSVSIVGSQNIGLSVQGSDVKISYVQGTAAVIATLWPAFILG